ncbi:gasdermin-C-like [Myotis lucifugus]|uniref:gasdermin-C-like n=1 Tax=Myotis lucifugus TaxID=59463 RepID=UPI000CCC60EC|nr:gasdermin-C-like [Myotis lucifugus]
MPSMFERTTKKLVKEIGDQELRPVKTLLSATKIHRFSLIQRKKARSWFWQRPDVPLDASLMDILEPGSSVPGIVSQGHRRQGLQNKGAGRRDAAVVSVLFSDTEVLKQQAAGSMNAGAEVGFSGETAACQESSLDIQIVSTPHETWTELQKRKLLDPEPALLKQCREAGVNLYVVTDTVELCNSPVLPDLSSANVSGKFFFPLNIFVKGEGQGGGLKVREKKLIVPKGSVLAYTRKQLVFYGREWGPPTLSSSLRGATETSQVTHTPTKFFTSDILMIRKPFQQKFFTSDILMIRKPFQQKFFTSDILMIRKPFQQMSGAKTSYNVLHVHQMSGAKTSYNVLHVHQDDGDDDDDDQKTFSADFRLLQEEVSQNIKAAELSKDMQGVVFSNLLAMLKDREDLQDCKPLQDLMDKLEQEPFGHLDGPGGTILTELQKDSCHPEVGSKCLILYLLEALMVLSDIQHVLLAQSMEKRILLLQRDLVGSILEPNFNCSENTPFTLQPELLAPLQGEGLAITYGLLDECGLEMELNSPRSTWDPEAKEPLSALYGALSVLSQLAEVRDHLGGQAKGSVHSD